MDLGMILDWLRRRRTLKRRRIAGRILKEIHTLTVTIHGRSMLTQVIDDLENGLDPEIRRMYWILLENAPIEQWANWN